MKKIMFFVVSTVCLTTILGVVALFIGQVDITSAHEPLETMQIQAIKVENQVVESQPDTGLVANTQPQEPNLVQEVQLLTEQWSNSVKKPGWVHVLSQHTEDYDDLSILPGGEISAKEYFMDEWYLLDNKGYLIQAAYIQRDINGNPIQISILRDDTWINLTYNIVSPVPREILPLEFVIDFGFPQIATELSESLEKQETNLSGKGVLLYTAREKYETPVLVSDFQQKIVEVDTNAYYDPDDGSLLLFEQVMIFLNGETRIRSSARILSVESEIEPPYEIQKYFEEATK